MTLEIQPPPLDLQRTLDYANENGASVGYTPEGIPIILFNQTPLTSSETTNESVGINSLYTDNIASLLEYPKQDNLTYTLIPDVLSGYTLIRRALEDQTVTVDQVLRYIPGIQNAKPRAVIDNIHTMIYNGKKVRNADKKQFIAALHNTSYVTLPTELRCIGRKGAKRFSGSPLKVYFFSKPTPELDDIQPSIIARATEVAAKQTAGRYPNNMQDILYMIDEKIISKKNRATFRRYIQWMVNRTMHAGCLSKFGKGRGTIYKQQYNPVKSLSIDHGPIKPENVTRELLYPNSDKVNERTGNIPGCSKCILNKGCGQLATFHYTLLGRVKDYYKQYEEDSRAVVLALLNENIATGQEA
ncbi:hypothetical protein KBD45_00910 [Candidatus Dojkabacteria bacterium]|nr:hypothetical protein [Candidatus Dojkabacteria bacterium]